jgi:succinylarginine dihydrolase
MWAANAATVVPAADASDHKSHFLPANLVSLLHRSIESEATELVLRRIFADPRRFVVHTPLPACDALADEGAANHTRLSAAAGALHLFAWGRQKGDALGPRTFPARQTKAASAAVARVCQLPDAAVLSWRQDPQGIDAGAFHTDVLAVGNGALLLLHERAFVEHGALLEELRRRLQGDFRAVVARDTELPLADAVAAYPFNSQLLTLPSGQMQLLAPLEARENERARRFLERAQAESGVIAGIDYLDVNGSMKNGGGPACLRLRVPLSEAERASLGGNVLFDQHLQRELTHIVTRRYRDRLELSDMADPDLVTEAHTALDELTTALGLGSVYDFQR